MGLFLTVAFLLISCFICLVNMHYREIECKNHSTWKKYSAFNSPKAWGLYASCIALILGGIFVVSIRNVVVGLSSIAKQQDSITQQHQQQDLTTQEQQDATIH